MQRDAYDPVGRAQEAEERAFREEQRRKRTALVLESVMSTREGREVVAGILDLTGLNASVFDLDHAAMSYREGRRSVGLDIVSLCRADLYQLLMKERNERRKQQH